MCMHAHRVAHTHMQVCVCERRSATAMIRGTIHLCNAAFRGYIRGNPLITPSVVSQSTHAPIHQWAAIRQSCPLLRVCSTSGPRVALPLLCMSGSFASLQTAHAACLSLYFTALERQKMRMFVQFISAASTFVHLWFSLSLPGHKVCVRGLPNLLPQSHGCGTAADILYQTD